MENVLAVDLGASGGRLIVGSFDGAGITLTEIHRFANGPVKIRGVLYWDILSLMKEIYEGIKKAAPYSVKSIGVDTWGVDFGLIAPDGSLLENPIHYRDSRTDGMLEKAFERKSKERFYQLTGIQFMSLNTVFQLLSLRLQREDMLQRADTLLFMPDLINYFLTGKQYAEYTIASTSQLLNVRSRMWSAELIDDLKLPKNIYPEIISSGKIIGELDKEIAGDLEIAPMKVIAVCGHDTQSAMVAVPNRDKDYLFISCGTWSLIGTELDAPILDDNAVRCNMTNEGGYGNKISFLKNVTGLWLLQQCRNYWNSQGHTLDYGELTVLAEQTPSQNIFLDTDDVLFAQPGNMPRQIDEYCRRTGQNKPEGIGGYVNCILESLALKYLLAIEDIRTCTGKHYPAVHLVGGGTKNKVLCQYTANACQLPVVAGPVEATALGNVTVQLIANGAIADLDSAKEILRRQKDVHDYAPQDAEVWKEKYKQFQKIIKH